MPYADLDVQRAYQRRWRQGRRDAWFENRSCLDCGSTESLELDHIDRTIKEDHNVWSWSLERREVELKKCVARCKDCHRKRTTRQRLRDAEERNPCGTRACYNRGCRCDACKKADRAHCQRMRANRKARVRISTQCPPGSIPGSPSECIGKDPLCPCQDGDVCHYVDHGDTKAWIKQEEDF